MYFIGDSMECFYNHEFLTFARVATLGTSIIPSNPVVERIVWPLNPVMKE